MCKCIEEVNGLLKKHNTTLTRQIMFKEGQVGVSGAMVSTEQIEQGKRKPHMKLQATYCPFCGVKYETDGANDVR